VSDRDVTQILHRACDGSDSAAAELMSAVYDELRALAEHYLQRERPDHTLQATALVHEAFLRLVDQTQAQFRDRSHFFAVAARAIRRILVDHARTRHRVKRGGQAKRLTIHDGLVAEAPRELDLVDLDDSLGRLAELNERQARIVELRFFGGLTLEETADVLGVSARTVDVDWSMARWWLRRELGRSDSS